jgi:hypothetical protein
MVFRKRGTAEGVLGVEARRRRRAAVTGAEKGTAAGPLAIACAADPITDAIALSILAWTGIRIRDPA